MKDLSMTDKHHADRYDPNETYVIRGSALNEILRVAYRMNDGMLLASFEQRDLAQRIQAQIEANVDGPMRVEKEF